MIFPSDNDLITLGNILENPPRSGYIHVNVNITTIFNSRKSIKVKVVFIPGLKLAVSRYLPHIKKMLNTFDGF